MTHRLILIRHAKSGWDDPNATDHARSLTPRGERAATAIGGWLQENKYLPDLILASDAQRTAQTANLIRQACTSAAEVQFTRKLYHADPATIADMIRQQTCNTLAVIGHNPGIGSLAAALVATTPPHSAFASYPTCATTVLDFDMANWGHLATTQGRLTGFIVPRDLTEDG